MTVEVFPPELAISGRAYPAPNCTATGTRWALFAHSDPSECWGVRAELDAGTTLHWDEAHGEEAIYVVRGALALEQGTCEAGAVLVVEAGVRADATCVGDTEIVHYGSWSIEPPADGPLGPPGDGRSVRVVPASGEFRAAQGPADSPLDKRVFADSTSPTCRLSLHRIDGTEGSRAGSHSHSEDEVMFLLDGELQFGPQTVRAGSFVAIAGGSRYGYLATKPFAFLNFRRNTSWVTAGAHGEPQLETAAGMGLPRVAPSA
jgi:quercetin dioxygenase-like cupin family protein